MNQSSAPEFDGNCAFALSLGKSEVEGSAEYSLTDGDKTYYFKNGVARFLWKVLPNRDAKANAAWASA